MKRSRSLLGFLISPLTLPILFFVVLLPFFLLKQAHHDPSSLRDLIMMVLLFSGYGIPIAYAITLVCFVPAVFWFQKKGWLKARHFFILGAVLGLLPFLVFDLVSMLQELLRVSGTTLETVSSIGYKNVLIYLAFGLICGTWCSAIYYAIAIHKSGRSAG